MPHHRSRALVRPALLASLLAAMVGAHAQSSVAVYGLVDLSAGRFRAPGGAADKAVEAGKMTTSYLGLRGSEDLGGGLRANFAIEHFMRPDTGAAGRFGADGFWTRSAFVGLSGGFGAVTIGRTTTSLFVQTLAFNAFGDAFGFSPSIRHYFAPATATGDTGWSDAVRYVSPRAGGASFTLHAAEPGNDGGGRNYGASAGWSGGPAALGLAWQSVKRGSAVNDTRTWQLAGSYDLKAVKLFAQAGHVDDTTARNSYRITGLGATVPMGSGKFLFQHGRVNAEKTADRSTTSIGYDHDLSKRTDIYAVGMADKLTGTGTGRSYALGVRHRF